MRKSLLLQSLSDDEISAEADGAGSPLTTWLRCHDDADKMAMTAIRWH